MAVERIQRGLVEYRRREMEVYTVASIRDDRIIPFLPAGFFSYNVFGSFWSSELASESDASCSRLGQIRTYLPFFHLAPSGTCILPATLHAMVQSVSSLWTRTPPELVLHLCAYCDSRTIAALSLVHSSWTDAASSALYDTIHFNITSHCNYSGPERTRIMTCLGMLSACPAKAALVRTLVITYFRPHIIPKLLGESLCAVLQHLRGLRRLYVKSTHEHSPLLDTIYQHMRGRTFDLQRLHIPAPCEDAGEALWAAIIAQGETLRLLTFEGNLDPHQDDAAMWKSLCTASRHGCRFFAYDSLEAIVTLFLLFIPEASWPAYFDLFTRIYSQSNEQFSLAEIYVHPTSDLARVVSLLPSAFAGLDHLIFSVCHLLPHEPRRMVIRPDLLTRALASFTDLRRIDFGSDVEITMSISDRLALALAVRDAGTALLTLSFPDGRAYRQGASWTWKPAP